MSAEKPGEQEKPASLLSLKDRVQGVLDRIRPYVQQDGGDVELDRVEEDKGLVYIKFRGACIGCPSSTATLHMGIENEIKIECPEVERVLQA